MGPLDAEARRAVVERARAGRARRRRDARHPPAPARFGPPRRRPRAPSTSRRPRPATSAFVPSPERTSATTCWWRSGSSRRRSGPDWPSTCDGCRGRSRRRAGPVVCSGSRAAPRSSSTAPTIAAGARALAAHLRQGPPLVLLFGAMSDKDLRAMAGALFPLAAEVVLTRPRIDRAATPSESARRAATPLAARAHRGRASPARWPSPAGSPAPTARRRRSSWPGASTSSGRSPRSWSGKGGGAEPQRQRLAPPSRRRRNGGEPLRRVPLRRPHDVLDDPPSRSRTNVSG